MQHGIMIPMSDNPAKMEIDEEGLIVGVTNRIRTMRFFGELSIAEKITSNVSSNLYFEQTIYLETAEL